jgi:hypothetical protein
MAAWKRVRKNKGSAGVDGMRVEQLAEHREQHGQERCEQLLQGTCQPQLVKRVEIPKPSGGVRQLGIPPVVDRFIQQALLQVLQARIDPSVSPHSYGFRPGRSAHDAVRPAQAYIQAGRKWVVDVDLEKFFDRVHHDVRDADDCNVYVGRRRAGERVLRLLRELFGPLRLTIHESKSAVAPATRRNRLGDRFWYGPGGAVKRRVADKATATMKQRVRQITRRSGGRSLPQGVEELRGYLLGWKGYFPLADTPRVFASLDQWMRHRLRAIQRKPWKRGRTVYRELRARGASHACRWWMNAAMLLDTALPNRVFHQLGLPRLAT